MSRPLLLAPAPLWRRLAAAVYDGLLVVAIWMSAAVLATPVLGYLQAPSRTPIQILAVLGAWYYFVRSWSRGGQTLGMRAWQLRLRPVDADRPVGLTAGSARYFAMLLLCILPLVLGAGAAAGRQPQLAGLVWLLLLPVLCMLPAGFGRRRALHDRLSGMEVQRWAAAADQATPARHDDGS